MKKTIAKIMAAAMVISSIAAPNVLASSANSYKVMNLSVGSSTIISNGVLQTSYTGKTESNAVSVDGTALLALMEASTNSRVSWTVTDDDGDALEIGVGALADANGDVQTKTDTSVTAGTADTKTVSVTGSNVAETIDLKTVSTSKVVVNDDFNAVIPNNIYDVAIAGNNLVVTINNTAATQAAIAAAINNGDTIDLTFTVTSAVDGQDITAPYFMKLVDTTATGANGYWNGFVKLKGDNNRYTPIRVHVDVYDTYANPAFALNNGFIISTGANNIIVENTFTTLSSNKLTIYDVNPVDLAVLQSDYAKGKNLMLDEVYAWWEFGNTNYYTTSLATWDSVLWNDLTGLEIVSLGKVTDIRSRVFKSCKEKLVHAKNVKFIRNAAFRKNKQLKKAVLSDDTSMKKINEKAFYDCKKLNTVKVKVKTLKQVGKNAFGGSTDKKSLKFNLKCSSKTQYNKAVKLLKKSGVKKAKFRKI